MNPMGVNEDRELQEWMSDGVDVIELSYSDVFLPLRMISDALQELVRDAVERDGSVRHDSPCCIIWVEVHMKPGKPVSVEPCYINSGTRRPENKELSRTVCVKGIARDAKYVGYIKVEAVCELYRHPQQDHGWEAGKVEVTWCWQFGEPETAKFRFENGWDLNDVYRSEIKLVQES